MAQGTQEKIEKQISENAIFLYMKGSKSSPQCGFSATIVNILNHLNVEYETFDVLSDEEVRTEIKILNNWPTIPQLYINGNFIGGCDIVKEMYQNGDLQLLIGQKSENTFNK